MIRFTLLSYLGLAEPLVRLQRRIEQSNRQAALRPQTRTYRSTRPVPAKRPV